MRRGCISLGDVKCDECQKPIPYPDRYLILNETNGVEDEEGDIQHYCVECSLKKGYAHYKEEKGERILTFF
jgi:hypothetical protein